ncbi:MAG TPA: 6-carboxytetrahydropterin synthase QueD [bacterium]|nr:6-carboxytetrahydropterin synthase QueD [bacterium]HEX67593.1 6-carboxytetrahydropterin synthase QueD [bacterium]
MLVSREFLLASAHNLPSYRGKCEKIHGHTYKLRITVEGEINEEGLAFDFKKLKEIVEEKVIKILDHTYLNEIIPVPSCENIAIWVWERLKDSLPLVEVRVWESPDTFVTLRIGKEGGE